MIPSYMDFRRALAAGYVSVRSRPYMDMVKGMDCVCCGRPADDPHHPYSISIGIKGAATKHPDIWCIPLCREHHDELHHDPAAWEEKYGSQIMWSLLTITQLWLEGKIGTKG